jgi:hypothetical protein
MSCRKVFDSGRGNGREHVFDVPVAVAEVTAVPLPEEVPLPVCEGVPVLDPVTQPVALSVPLPVALPAALLVAVPEETLEGVPAALTVGAVVRVALPEAVARALPVPLAVAEGVQEGSAEEPAAQDGVHTHGVQVAMEDAPSAGEKVPAGHGTGLLEEIGQ